MIEIILHNNTDNKIITTYNYENYINQLFFNYIDANILLIGCRMVQAFYYRELVARKHLIHIYIRRLKKSLSSCMSFSVCVYASKTISWWHANACGVYRQVYMEYFTSECRLVTTIYKYNKAYFYHLPDKSWESLFFILYTWLEIKDYFSSL